jgi:GH25 family lysozyme M1 (1,4-beta-N-acetylmuramidase)
MTRYLADYSAYQGTLTAADFHRAEFQVINFKISHDLEQTSVHPKLVSQIASAKALTMGIATYHWLTGDHSGTEQAKYAHSRLKALGLLTGTMHTVDVEEQADSDAEKAPTLAHVRDYVATMKQLLGRPVAIYTGDWWWMAPGRGWNGNALSPYLMAAPNAGYLDAYPGASSTHWNAGYGGWKTLSVMQYAGAAPLLYPGGSKSTVKVSKSAIRDEAVWRALSGGK